MSLLVGLLSSLVELEHAILSIDRTPLHLYQAGECKQKSVPILCLLIKN